ncbi:hypothetical protein M9H77_07049 [Catharanthus roseus]|uniref:Uncharacterized protein n=1 Tax=Catharanthus roseus TaxID=4058 RepID=A0ACC0BTU0_CATRO|nr:hypothetical protein M9H77_07049 [Catharanthus roseus]
MGEKTGNFRPPLRNFSNIFAQTGETVYNHGHAQAAKLTEEQFRKSHVLPPNILRFSHEQNVGCAIRYKIYNVVAKIKKNGMQGRNTVEEVLCLSAQRSYTVFYRNREESNVLSDIIVAHPTPIAMIRTWSYVLIMDIMYKTNKVAFWVEITNHAESEHSVLKLWLSTCHGDLDTVFLNIDSISKLKEKYEAKGNPILKNVSNHISHLALKKIWLEIKKAGEISNDPESKCGHYLRKSHRLPCACELFARYQHMFYLQSKDVYIFWRKLEVGINIPSVHERDMDSEMCDLTCLLEEIITKGRRKTNTTKMDKSYWEHVSIAHRKIGKSSGSGSSLGSVSGSGSGPSPHGRGRLLRSSRGRGRGRNSLSSAVNPNAPLTPFPFRSTAVLPLYSNMDGTAGTLCIGFIWDQQHFIQMPVTSQAGLMAISSDVRVSRWAEPYYERIAEWVRRSYTEYPTQDPTHVVIP